MQTLGHNIWLVRFPLGILGIDIGRNVTVMRLESGDLVIHSTAPFSGPDVAMIRSLGRPAWILDAMLSHDTFAGNGRHAFPEARYLAPEGFCRHVDFPVEPLLPPPAEWLDEIEVSKIEGVPGFEEHVFFHRRSRSLIVADLLFNVPQGPNPWVAFALKLALKNGPDMGVSRRLLLAVRNEALLRESLYKVLDWDFNRIVVGHGAPVFTDAKHRALRAWQAAGVI